MDDLLKKLAIAAAGLTLIHFALDGQVRAAARREARTLFGRGGSVHTVLRTDSPFDLFAGRIDSLTLNCADLRTPHVELDAEPHRGWKGTIRHLRLHVTDWSLARIPVSRFDADLPGVRFDLGRALWRGDLLITSAGAGTAEADLTDSGLETAISQRLDGTVSNLIVDVEPDRVHVTGVASLLGLRMRVAANGSLSVDESGRVLFVPTSLTLNGQPASVSMSSAILRAINPVFDVERDLSAGELLHIDRVLLAHGTVTLVGTLRLPVRPASAGSPR